jgi:hypothetical protein
MHEVNQSGIPMFILAGGFGLWWLLAPRSVIYFYSRLSKRAEKHWTNAKPWRIRMVGLFWTALVVYFFCFYTRPPN